MLARLKTGVRDLHPIEIRRNFLKNNMTDVIRGITWFIDVFAYYFKTEKEQKMQKINDPRAMFLQIPRFLLRSYCCEGML